MNGGTVRLLAARAGFQWRTLSSLIAVLLLVNSLVVVRHAITPVAGSQPRAAADASGRYGAGGSPNGLPGSGKGEGAPAPGALGTAEGNASGTGNPAGPGTDAGGLPRPGLRPPGVTAKDVKVVYYWKGDRTKASPYLGGTGQDGNVDEAKAFRVLVQWINKHAGGGATLMGFPFNLHGRKLKGVVRDVETYAWKYPAYAESIARDDQPFAAISSHGSLSAYICPHLAKYGIHNFATYDLGARSGTLAQRTNGYCTPSGMSWETQVDTMLAYLQKDKARPYTVGPAQSKRVYGFLYARYPGLIDSAPKVVQRFRRAGVNIAATFALDAELADAQQQGRDAVAAFRSKGVNTIISPDAGAPLNFTHAAQANGYNPDYAIWPCSGQDSEAMARLYNAAQWTRASGLTCYDPQLTSDLTLDDHARRTEWFKAYVEITGDTDVPAQTPLVYMALLPLVVGLTNAGPDITVESVHAGLSRFTPYRYDAIGGRTGDAANMLLTTNVADRSPVGDVAKIVWSPTTRKAGAATAGAYVFPENRRYARGAAF